MIGEGNGHLTNDGPSARDGTLSPQPHDKSSTTPVPPRLGFPTEPPLADTEPPDSWKQPVRDARPTNPSLSHLFPPQTRCRSNSFSPLPLSSSLLGFGTRPSLIPSASRQIGLLLPASSLSNPASLDLAQSLRPGELEV
ncbi:hypothetical protein BHE74_00029631 [Ensete ventricosum]|nr:hypothetical protein BHE74_00029631 [Ensete ventricosum]